MTETRTQSIDVAATASSDEAARSYRYMMCPPDHFNVHYAINPWMEGNHGRADHAEAMRQWNRLRAILAEECVVETMEPAVGLPDLVFTANSGLMLGEKVVLANFRHVERRPEKDLDRKWFAGQGYKIYEMPEDLFFEGTGDALLDRAHRRIWMGYGFRTSLEVADHIARWLDIEVMPLRLVDPRFYHLDTCFAPLTGGYLLYYPGAFDDRAQRTIAGLVPEDRRHAVSERDALDFACNCVDTGRNIVMSRASGELEAKLAEWGFGVRRCPLDQFHLSGGSARCLVLRLNEDDFEHRPEEARSGVASQEVRIEDHLLDTGLLAHLINHIEENGGEFEMREFRAGVRKQDKSWARLAIKAPNGDTLDKILDELLRHNARPVDADTRPARLETVEIDGVAPDDFYSTTIYPTEVLIGETWYRADHQRMDGVLAVDDRDGEPKVRVKILRDILVGEKIVVGHQGLRLHRVARHDEGDDFAFMSSEVSSERRVETAVDSVAWEMVQIRRRGGRILLVSGPVAVHTGGVPHLCELVRGGFIQGVLAGNALAVHDIERAFYGTSLGVDLNRGVTVVGGHRNHISAINRIRRCGGIHRAVEQGVLTRGFMHELARHDVPFCLAGSIRDDGPLPDTEMDMEKAQARYMELMQGADMVLMLSSMLHSIAVGNMTPAGVKMVCVDINPAVATKLADRGSVESIPVVTDVGLFLNLLVRKIQSLGNVEPAVAS